MQKVASRAERATRSPPAPIVKAAPALPEPAAPVAVNGNGNSHHMDARADAHGPIGPVSPEKVRRPLGQLRQKLDNAQRPGFHRHWFNDDDKGRIKDAIEAGYTHVEDEAGKPMSRVVGTKKEGGALVAYRMELPIDLWQGDQNEKISARRQRQSQMQSGMTGKGGPGDDGRYVVMGPDGRPMTQIKHEAR